MTGKGKIARLPREIRDQLNRRLDEGEAGKRPRPMVNELPEVKAVLAGQFGGRPINEPNLVRMESSRTPRMARAAGNPGAGPRTGGGCRGNG